VLKEETSTIFVELHLCSICQAPVYNDLPVLARLSFQMLPSLSTVNLILTMFHCHLKFYIGFSCNFSFDEQITVLTVHHNISYGIVDVHNLSSRSLSETHLL